MQWKWKIQLDNQIIEYIVGQNQQQQLTLVFDEQIAHAQTILRFHLERDAQLAVYVLIKNIDMQVKIECILSGEGAHAQIYGAYMGSGENVIKIDTLQHHKAAYTSSKLVMKGALRDKAYADYHGDIRVEKKARGVCASQENKNILINPGVRAVSVPNLQVLNNEVKCFHGSAIGKFDEQVLFYMASRGIDETVSEKILLDAFFADVIGGEVGWTI